MPSSATPLPAASSRGTSRIRIFARRVSTSASAAHSTTSATGSQSELPPRRRPGGAGRPGRRARARASGGPRPPTAGRRGRGPRTRAAGPRGSSSARGACPGCRPADAPSPRSRRARTRPPRARAPGSTRRAVPAVAAITPREVGRAGDQRGDGQRPARASPPRTPLIVRSRLAPISAKPFATSHEAAASANRASASRPSSASASWPTPSDGAGRRRARAAPRRATAAAATAGREPVDDGGALDRDGALAPQPAQLPVRLQRRRAAPSLQPRLPVLHEPGQKRRQHEAADDLNDARRALPRRSSDHAQLRARQQRRRRARSGTTTYVPEPTALQPPRARRAPRLRRRGRPAGRRARRSGAGRGPCRRPPARRRRPCGRSTSRSGRSTASSASRSGFVNPALVQSSAGSTSWPHAQRRRRRRRTGARARARSAPVSDGEHAARSRPSGSEPVPGSGRPTCAGAGAAHGASPTSDPNRTPGASPEHDARDARARATPARIASGASPASRRPSGAAARAARGRPPSRSRTRPAPPSRRAPPARRAPASPSPTPPDAGTCSSACSVSHSEAKPFSGGSPAIANAPTRNAPPVHGMRRSSPPSRSSSSEPTAFSNAPAPRNSSALKTAWLSVCSSAARERERRPLRRRRGSAAAGRRRSRAR